ncbi:MAG: RDD family protein [Opitutales bacterium]
MQPPPTLPPPHPPDTPHSLPDLEALSPAHRLRPGSYRLRMVAFLLDFVLVFVLTGLILEKVVWPQFEGGKAELLAYSEDFFHVWVESSGEPDLLAALPEPSEQLKQLLGTSHMTVLLTFWMGFFLGDTLMGGRSLGKRVFRLRVVPRDRLGSLHLAEGLLRSGLKTLTLVPFPVLPLLLVNYLIPLLTSRRRAGHDFLCRSWVISEPNTEPVASEISAKSA